MEFNNAKDFVLIKTKGRNGNNHVQALKKSDALRELNRRISNNQNGVKMLFEQSGIPLKNDGKVSLEDAKNMAELNPEQFGKMMNFLYPDILAYQKANAEGETSENSEEKEKNSFNWVGLMGGLLQGAGSALSSMNTTDTSSQLAMQDAQHKAELAEQASKSSQKTLWIVLGVVAVVIVAAIIIIKRK